MLKVTVDLAPGRPHGARLGLVLLAVLGAGIVIVVVRRARSRAR